MDARDGTIVLRRRTRACRKAIPGNIVSPPGSPQPSQAAARIIGILQASAVEIPENHGRSLQFPSGVQSPNNLQRPYLARQYSDAGVQIVRIAIHTLANT